MLIKNTIATDACFHFYRELGCDEVCYLEIREPGYDAGGTRGFIAVPAEIMTVVARSWLAARRAPQGPV